MLTVLKLKSKHTNELVLQAISSEKTKTNTYYGSSHKVKKQQNRII